MAHPRYSNKIVWATTVISENVTFFGKGFKPRSNQSRQFRFPTNAGLKCSGLKPEISSGV